MSQKIAWIDNLRALACMMVVMIHASTFQVVNFATINSLSWQLADVLNAFSRAAVPVFFMISGYLFWGEKSARPRHFLRIALCWFFYSALAVFYLYVSTKMGFWPLLKNILQRPVFYHLWFFYAIGGVYLLSPFIEIKKVSLPLLVTVAMVLGVLANPQLPALNWQGFHLLPLNLYITGDAFYYLLYALFGRALGILDYDKPWLGWAAAITFVASSLLIAIGTELQSQHNQNFASTYYFYCGPLVFIAALSLFLWARQALARLSWPPLRLISRHSLAIYGFHALIIIGLRSSHLDFPRYPLLNIAWLFISGLLGGLLLALLLSRVDGKRWVN